MNNELLKEKNLHAFEQAIHVIILMNVVAFVLESIKELSDYYVYFQIFENVSLIVFIAEYGIRIYLATLKKNTWQYIFSFMGIVDFITILPAFFGFYADMDLRFAKLLRFFQIFRIFKVYRHSEHLQTVFEVIVRKKDELLATLFATVLILVFCSFVAYFFEKDVHPHKFTNMLMSFYWAIETLTTTGYGDIYPLTVGGRIVASILALLGIGLLAIPAAILSAGFVELQEEKRKHAAKKKHESHTDN